MALQSLPSPAIEIISLIKKEGTLSSRDILECFKDKHQEKAVKYAIRRLLENKLIHRVPNLLDMRSVYYRLATPDELSEIRSSISESISQEIEDAIA